MPPMPPAVRNGARNVRSEFLKSRLGSWMEAASASGKAAELLELEMWLRSFERFFRIKNQPLSEKEAQQLALRNWSEELRLVDNVILRSTQALHVDPRDEGRQPGALRQATSRATCEKGRPGRPLRRAARCGRPRPRPASTLLRESLEDIHLAAREPDPALAHPLRDASPRWGGSSTARSGAATSLSPCSSTRSSSRSTTASRTACSPPSSAASSAPPTARTPRARSSSSSSACCAT